MTKPWILVSPASRGIGLHLARRLLQTTPLPVVATARHNTEQTHSQILEGISSNHGSASERLHVLQLDVTQEDTIAAAASHCKSLFPSSSSSYLRLAFCIPGILHPEKAPSQVDAAKALDTFTINTLGPLLLSKHFSPFLPSRKTPALESFDGVPATTAVMALMSARVGSITDNALGGWYSYRASKAGVNALAKSVDVFLRQRCGERAMCLALHPGTVKTGLSEEFWGSTPKEKFFSPEFAAERLCAVVSDVGLEGRGKCWDWKGEEIPP